MYESSVRRRQGHSLRGNSPRPSVGIPWNPHSLRPSTKVNRIGRKFLCMCFVALVLGCIPAALTAQSTLISPTPGSTFTSANVTFNWTADTNATGYYLWIGSTGVGSNNLYNSAEKTGTSYTFSSMPANGETIYVRLITNHSGTWVHNDYTYTAASQAVLTSPAPGSTLASASVTFGWTAAANATGYYLWIGSTGVGSNNLYNSAEKTGTSYTFSSMPANSETVYVRLITNYSGTWVYNDYSYTAASQAVLTSPAPGSTLASANVAFGWTASANATGYYLLIGSTGVGSNNLYNSAEKTGTSYTFNSMPTNGGTIYVRLITNFSGTWVHNDYTYTAASQAMLTSPTPGSALTGASVTFAWTAAANATGYYMLIGSTGVGSNNLYNSAEKTGTSYTFNSMPTNGETVYVRLVTNYSGTWMHNDYTYTAAGTLPALNALSCGTNSMTGAGTVSCSVTLNGKAPGNGLSVNLSSNNSAVTVPSTVVVPANSTTTAFTATVASVATAQSVVLTATSGTVTKTFALQLGASVPTLVVATSGSPATYGATVTFTATISNGPIGSLTFYDGATSIGSATISGTTATLMTSSLTAGSHTVSAKWAGNSNYAAVTSAAVNQVINKATPTVSWATPAAISYGTALNGVQLDATSAVPGTFTYTPASGTVPKAGTETLSVTFTPTDSTDYAPATATVTLTVNQATPMITWATPAAISSGTALSSTQLDATSSIPGTFVYSPPSGTVLPAGTQTLSVTLTPTDTTDYTTATKTVTLTVSSTAAFVQAAASTTSGSKKTLSLSFPANTVAGDIILVGFDFATGLTPSSITDSQGNTFTAIGSQLSSPGGVGSVVYYAKNIKGGADAVTVTLSASSTFIELYLTEYAGMDPTNPIDAEAGASGSAGSVSSGNATTSAAGDVIYGYCVGDTACTVGSGFTARSTFDENLIEDQTAGNAGSYAATASAGSGWTMHMVALKPAGSGSITPAPAITSAASASGTVGSSFSYQISATNSPTSYGATGLPAGLTVNTGTGLISGTPTTAGTSTVTLSATNTGGSGTATLTLTIAPVGPSLSINATSVAFGNVVLNTMTTQVVTLSSVGSTSVTVSSATVTGTGFSLAGNTYSGTLAPGQTASLGVQFDPTTAGAATGQLTIISNSSNNSTAAIPLTGTGTAASYAVDLSWSAPESSTDPVAGYNVYRANSGSSTYQLLNSPVDTETTFTDSTVEIGQSYDYIVESVDSSGVESAPTSPIAVTIP